MFSRDKSNTPNGFATKLRKHLKTRRLCDIQQIGSDRIVDFRFGDGEFGKIIYFKLGTPILGNSNTLSLLPMS